MKLGYFIGTELMIGSIIFIAVIIKRKKYFSKLLDPILEQEEQDVQTSHDPGKIFYEKIYTDCGMVSIYESDKIKRDWKCIRNISINLPYLWKPEYIIGNVEVSKYTFTGMKDGFNKALQEKKILVYVHDDNKIYRSEFISLRPKFYVYYSDLTPTYFMSNDFNKLKNMILKFSYENIHFWPFFLIYMSLAQVPLYGLMLLEIIFYNWI